MHTCLSRDPQRDIADQVRRGQKQGLCSLIVFLGDDFMMILMRWMSLPGGGVGKPSGRVIRLEADPLLWADPSWKQTPPRGRPPPGGRPPPVGRSLLEADLLLEADPS